jgi:hypothetical protein
VIGDLLELVWISLAATVLLSTAASVCVLGVTRGGELRRAGDGAGAMRWLALGVLGGLVVAASAVGAVVIIVSA